MSNLIKLAKQNHVLMRPTITLASFSNYLNRSYVRYNTFTTCQPNLVFTKCGTSVSPEKQTLSNWGTIWPRLNSPRSPPRLPEGQVEYFFASVWNFAPFFSCLIMSSACSLCFTRIWSAAAVFAIVLPLVPNLIGAIVTNSRRIFTIEFGMAYTKRRLSAHSVVNFSLLHWTSR